MKRKFVIMPVLFSILVFNIHGLEYEFEIKDLQESIEMMIIREMAKVDDAYQKLIALEYIEDVITQERKSIYLNEIVQVLEFLYLDAIENNRDVFNFIYIRLRVTELLGEIGTEEAKNALVLILQNDNEEKVLVNALMCLNKIADNDNGEIIANIVLCFKRNYIINGLFNPFIAFATIHALGEIARESKIILDPDAMGVLSFISLEARYSRGVRGRAMAEYEYWLSIINNK